MKAIAPNAFRPQRARNRQDTCNQRHMRVKTGVKTRDLHETWKMRLREPDDGQCGRHVQRREDGGGLQFGENRVIDAAMLHKLRPAMHDAMPNTLWYGHFSIPEKVGHEFDRLKLAGNGRLLLQQGTRFRVLGVERALVLPDRLRFAHDDPKRATRAHAVESKLER